MDGRVKGKGMSIQKKGKMEESKEVTMPSTKGREKEKRMAIQKKGQMEES